MCPRPPRRLGRFIQQDLRHRRGPSTVSKVIDRDIESTENTRKNEKGRRRDLRPEVLTQGWMKHLSLVQLHRRVCSRPWTDSLARATPARCSWAAAAQFLR